MENLRTAAILFPYFNLVVLSPSLIGFGCPTIAIATSIVSLVIVVRFFGGFIQLPLILGTLSMVVLAVLSIVR